MAYSYVNYPGVGTGPYDFSMLNYLDVAHIVVAVGGVAKDISDDYTISGEDVTLTVAPTGDDGVSITRVTPRAKGERLVDFADGAVLTEADLDTSALQNLYIAQEAFEYNIDVVGLDTTSGKYTANDKEIINVADPSTDDSAVNRKYMTDSIQFGVGGVPQLFLHTFEEGDSATRDLDGWSGINENMLLVSLDGVVQRPGEDFSVVDSASSAQATSTITLLPDPVAGQKLSVQNFGIAKNVSGGAGSVTTDLIADDAVNSDKLANTAVETGHIEEAAVTESKIAVDSVNFDRLKDTAFATGISTASVLKVAATSGDLSVGTLDHTSITDWDATLQAVPISDFALPDSDVVLGDGATEHRITNLYDGSEIGVASTVEGMQAHVLAATQKACMIVPLKSNYVWTTTATAHPLKGAGAADGVPNTIGGGGESGQMGLSQYDPNSLISIDYEADRITLIGGHVYLIEVHNPIAWNSSWNTAFIRLQAFPVGGGTDINLVPEVAETSGTASYMEMLMHGTGAPSIHIAYVFDPGNSTDYEIEYKVDGYSSTHPMSLVGGYIKYQQLD